jgi:hypothetical protein
MNSSPILLSCRFFIRQFWSFRSFRLVNSSSVQHIFSRKARPELVDELLLSISLIIYALQSLVMQWDLGITIAYAVGFTDFSGFKDANFLSW